MPINSPHPDYASAMAWWQRCRDAAEGTDAVKSRRTEYLPKLSGQTDADYNSYLQRSMFYPATDRTINGLIGSVMRRPPVVACTDEILSHMDDVTLSDDTLQEFTSSMLHNVMTTGRVGVLVDIAQTGGRPYWSLWSADNIINWRLEKGKDGTTAPTMIVLRETVPSPVQNDPFAISTYTRYRLLSIIDGRYVVTTWTRTDDRSATPDRWISGTPVLPTRNGKPLTFIPFVCVGPRGVGFDVDKPPLLDLVDVNLSHYRNSADLEHGRHFTALPTPYITGWVEPPEGSTGLRIGSGSAWTLQNSDAKVGMLEFTGQGLRALETALDQKERQMAVLGSRLLEVAPKGAETAEAVRLRHTGEHAVLATISGACSQALTKVLKWHTWWLGGSDAEVQSAGIELNRDFFDTVMQPNEAEALMKLWQSGAITYETLYWNLQRGEWARPGITVEEEKAGVIKARPVGDEAENQESPDDEGEDVPEATQL